MIALWDFGTDPSACCSYSYNQPYCTFALTTTSEPGMAVAADTTPWGGDRTGAFSSFVAGTDKDLNKLGNSINHQDEGQNVLFLDSHVTFESVSFCGVNEDNIYTPHTNATATADIRKGKEITNGAAVPMTRQDNVILCDFGTTGGGKDRGDTSCFLGDTLVNVNGSMTEISQVATGQTLGNSAIVEKLDEHVGSFKCRDIVFADGSQISVVEKHYFMLDSGIWVISYDLRSGMTLRTQNGTAEIKSVTVREQPYVGKVYNIKVQNSEQYIVGSNSVVVRDW